MEKIILSKDWEQQGGLTDEDIEIMYQEYIKKHPLVRVPLNYKNGNIEKYILGYKKKLIK